MDKAAQTDKNRQADIAAGAVAAWRTPNGIITAGLTWMAFRLEAGQILLRLTGDKQLNLLGLCLQRMFNKPLAGESAATFSDGAVSRTISLVRGGGGMGWFTLSCNSASITIKLSILNDLLAWLELATGKNYGAGPDIGQERCTITQSGGGRVILAIDSEHKITLGKPAGARLGRQLLRAAGETGPLAGEPLLLSGFMPADLIELRLNADGRPHQLAMPALLGGGRVIPGGKVCVSLGRTALVRLAGQLDLRF